MALRVGIIGSTTPSGAPTWRDDELQAFEKNFLNEGVISGFAVSQYSGGANMSVDVALGDALIEITNANLTPSKTYKVFFNSDATENKTVTAADGTHPRKDRVVLRVGVSANPNSAASDIAIVEVLAGTPAASPSAPAEPSNAITLAIIDIPASDTTIGNAQITDSRTFVTVNASRLADLQREATAIKTTRAQFADFTEKTIASGVITVTQPLHTVDTEADASTDDLDTITAGYGAGEIIHLRPEHTDRSVVIKHGTGNIRTADGLDFTMDNTDKSITLIRKGSTWFEVCRAVGTLTTHYYKTLYSRAGNSASVGTSTAAQTDYGTHTPTIPANFFVLGNSVEIEGSTDDTWVTGTSDVYIKLGSTIMVQARASGVDASGKHVFRAVLHGTGAVGASVAVLAELTTNYGSLAVTSRVGADVGSQGVATNGALALAIGHQFGGSNAGHASILKSLKVTLVSETPFS